MSRESLSEHQFFFFANNEFFFLFSAFVSIMIMVVNMFNKRINSSYDNGTVFVTLAQSTMAIWHFLFFKTSERVSMQSKSGLLAAASSWFTTFASPSDGEPSFAAGERSIGLIKPQPQLAVKDSNLANFGTKLEYDIKEQAAKTEPACKKEFSPFSLFDHIFFPKGPSLESLACLFGVSTSSSCSVSTSQDSFMLETGFFFFFFFPFSNHLMFLLFCSYVVLFTKAVVRETKTVLMHDVHFWLGGTTSQDEAGTAVCCISLVVFL
jgi:hypothetical protein